MTSMRLQNSGLVDLGIQSSIISEPMQLTSKVPQQSPQGHSSEGCDITSSPARSEELQDEYEEEDKQDQEITDSELIEEGQEDQERGAEDEILSDEEMESEDEPMDDGAEDMAFRERYYEENENFRKTRYDTPVSPEPPAAPAPYVKAYDYRERDPKILRTMRTAFDYDNSGDYDPRAENRRKHSKKRDGKRRAISLPRTGFVVNADPEDEDAEESLDAPQRPKAPTSKLKARQEGLHLEVIFRYESYEMQQLLAGWVDNWPDDEAWNIFVDESIGESSGTGMTQVVKQRHRRRRARDYRSSSNVDEVITDPLTDPDRHQEDLRNHPAARGCVTCRRLDLACPLLKDPNAYPCALCPPAEHSSEDTGSEDDPRSDQRDCQLLVAPEYRQRCQSCKRADYDCSLADNPDQPGPCDECVTSSSLCVAGPLPGHGRQRISVDNPLSLQNMILAAAADRTYIQCTRCRLAKRRCSLKTKDDLPPCKTCVKDGTTCDFLNLRKLKTKKLSIKGGKKDESEDVMDQDTDAEQEIGENQEENEDLEGEDEHAHSTVEIGESSPSTVQVYRGLSGPTLVDEPQDSRTVTYPIAEVSGADTGCWMMDVHGNSGTMTQIRTQFAHPMAFMLVGDPWIDVSTVEMLTLKHPHCNFCQDLTYGLGGLGQVKTVDVLKWDSGLGYSELEGGYTANGIEPTRMCANCTLQREFIVECDQHIIGPLKGSEHLKTVAGNDDAINRLFDGVPLDNEYFCTFCYVYAATSACEADKDADHLGNELRGDSGMRRGCGLYLCERCVAAYKDEIRAGGSFQTFIEILEKGCLENAENGDIRADVGLLSREGLLVKTTQNGIDEAEEAVIREMA
ncbi:hypothetical protein EJ05DRAFT_505588 [Pseudovirgaria hyperparasitica]|uniref:Zn(2)-C6 fungal-type domain-containing protein n=1 Tax=Pseudovirgaria hyperparasitica TaxID=470096 RepID=A0A6A6VTD0_9PEZI|nr:uncharacterized protein EJ05DRAFT_505588 [Pseudovirgaria hyperparasitica]KAF2752850.1 hypothetical protein EJ05DRAFT_505588 [Pseudovirgaria hyperparasitica]